MIRTTLRTLASAALALSLTSAFANPIQYARVDGLNVAYREAGPANAPTIVLLHGFPSSSHMFRNLIPILAAKYHVIAPDYIGFGYSDAPSPSKWAYSFDHLTQVTDDFLQQKGIKKYALYMQDYGGPVGFRIAAAHPERVLGLIVQNSNAYEVGISDLAKDALGKLGADRNPETEKPVRYLISPAGIRFQYTTGTDAARVDPDGYTFDSAILQQQAESAEIQIELAADYKSNVALYSSWHQYFRASQPKMLILWGKGDPFFTVAGSKAFAQDLKSVEYNLYDAGHFALEERPAEFAAKILKFMNGLQ